MITLISGTNRPGSNTLKVTRMIADLYRQLGVPTHLIDLQELPLELFLPTSYASKPTNFAPFEVGVLEASGLVVVTPEYNGSFPGVLKLFIDHLKFPESFEGRPVCFVGLAAGVWGALRSVEQLQGVFGYRNAHVFPKRVFLPGINGMLGDDGQFNNEDAVRRLRDQAADYVAFVEKIRGTSLRSFGSI